MCPNQSDQEWLEIKENRPTEFDAAVKLDAQIRERDPHAWIHKSCKPLAEVDFNDKTQDLFNTPCDSGVCFV